MGSPSSTGTPGIPDDERPLTPKGEKRMRQIARGLRRLDLTLDRIVTSPLPRPARPPRSSPRSCDAEDLLETADVLRAGTDAAAIRNWLRERTEDRLMIVGHNPALSDLITLLVLGSAPSGPQVHDLKKGGIAALEPAIGIRDRYELVWVATPGLIRRLSAGKGN